MKFKTHKIFIYLSLIFGISLVFLVAPFQSPDEDSHFKKAYVISKGELFSTVENNVNGFDIPENMLITINDYNEMMGNRDAKIKYSDIVISDRLGDDFGNTKHVNFSTAETTPFAHIIQSIGIIIGKIFWNIFRDGNGSTVYLLYFARLANLLFYISIVAYAIKITPILKKTMCALTLMPMSLSLAASCSYDSILICLTCLSFSYIMNIILKENEWFLDKKNMAIMIMMAFVMFAIKPYCALLYLLLFFTPKNKFNDTKDYIKKIVIFACTVIGLYIIFRVPNMLNASKIVTEGTTTPAVSPLSDPITFLKLVFKNLFYQRDYYLATTVGVLGLIDTYLPTSITCLYMIFVLIIAIVEMSYCKYKINIYTKISIIFITLISLVGISYVMVGWSAVIDSNYNLYGNMISGIQGRYLIPLLVPLGLVFYNNKLNKFRIVNKTEIIIEEYQSGIYIAVLILTLFTVLLRFWV